MYLNLVIGLRGAATVFLAPALTGLPPRPVTRRRQ
jgi:hypothetical protein